jgi:hypothetical protein
MTATSHSKSSVRTTNLTMAAYLMALGFDFDLELTGDQVDGHPVGAWVFPGEARDHAMEFNAGEARVEPASFHRAIGSTRREMFRFLKVGNEAAE